MGSISKRPTGKWRARYRDATGKERAKHFERKEDARKWLKEQTGTAPTLYTESRADALVRYRNRFLRTLRTALYRHYDAEGRLLYVGITNNLRERTRQHADSAPWFPSVARSTVDYYNTRDEAIAAERAAVANEKPLHNVLLQHKATSRPSNPPPTPEPTSTEDDRIRVIRIFPRRDTAERAAAQANAEEPNSGWRAVPVARNPRWAVVRNLRTSDEPLYRAIAALREVAVEEFSPPH